MSNIKIRIEDGNYTSTMVIPKDTLKSLMENHGVDTAFNAFKPVIREFLDNFKNTNTKQLLKD